MQRRNFLKKTVITTASASAIAGCSQPIPKSSPLSQPVVNWRMTTSWPKYLDIITDGIEVLCRAVSTMTSGRFTITPYAGGEIVPPLEVLDAVAAGKVECGHTASYYYLNKSPALTFSCTLPFGLNAEQHDAWIYGGGGQEVLNNVYGQLGILCFAAGNTGTQMGGWFRKEINTVADLKGLRVRIPGLGGNILTQMGAIVKQLPAQDIVPALLKGTIDAVEWIGPYDDAILGLQKAAPFYYYPGWWEPGTSFVAMVNRSVWEKLPKDYQAVFQVAAAEANVVMLARYNAANGELLDRLLLGGTQLLPFSSEILQTSQKIAFELYQEMANKDATFREVYNQWQQFRHRIYKWNRISTLSFSQFAFNNP